MSAVINERLFMVAQAARQAGHGGKGAIYQAACAELGISLAKLHRKLDELTVKAPRKQRKDAGETSLSYAEAQWISALLIEATRKNGKRILSVEDAMLQLRSNGQIKAEYLNADTGEVRPLSTSTIHRALKVHNLHPDQLMQPAPVTELASLHPNHVWQVDASLCTLYYLSNGLKGMAAQVYYKNKPGNLERVAAQRVWRYVVTDHASGWIYVEYVLGAESGENLCSVMINAMQARGVNDVLHGVPVMVMTDPGAAMTGALFRNLCKALGIILIINQVGNARAKGQVENGNNLVETKFEPGLKLHDVESLAALNALATKWRVHFNATALHSRHGQTRSNVWMQILASQLIKAPSIEVCRDLASSNPEERQVSSKLTVSFRGDEYDVSSVPNVMVKQKLLITLNPWRDDAAQVVLTDADGREVLHVVDKIERNALGFRVDAPVVNEAYQRHADTPAQTAVKEIELLVTGTSNATEAAAARKAKAVPFNGQIDFYKHINEAQLPSFMPRRGTEHGLIAPKIEYAPLSHFDAARSLKPLLEAAGGTWSATTVQWLQQRYPDGVPQDEFDNIVTALTQAKPTGLVRVA